MSLIRKIASFFERELVKPRISKIRHEVWQCHGAGLTGFAPTPRDAYQGWAFLAEERRIRHVPLRYEWNVLTSNLSEA